MNRKYYIDRGKFINCDIQQISWARTFSSLIPAFHSRVGQKWSDFLILDFITDMDHIIRFTVQTSESDMSKIFLGIHQSDYPLEIEYFLFIISCTANVPNFLISFFYTLSQPGEKIDWVLSINFYVYLYSKEHNKCMPSVTPKWFSKVLSQNLVDHLYFFYQKKSVRLLNMKFQ